MTHRVLGKSKIRTFDAHLRVNELILILSVFFILRMLEQRQFIGIQTFVFHKPRHW